MSVYIKEVTTRSDLKEFIKFPFRLYRDHDYWVPPLREHEMATLDQKKNPAFDYCEAKYWLAYRGGEIVGRIAGIINHAYIRKWGNKYARFGWIDFIDDAEVSKELLSTVEKWAAEKGMKAVHGPLGFTDLDFEGMLTEGFEELGSIATIYNYPYYVDRVMEYSYSPDTHWIEFQVQTTSDLPEKLDHIADRVMEKLQLKIIRAKKPKDILPYAKGIFRVLNDAYKDLYGVVPLTDRQVQYYTKLYFGFVRADFISIIVDRYGDVIAFGITMPSLAKAFQKAKGSLFPFGFVHILKAMKKNDRADLLLVGISPEYQGKGVNAIMIRELYHIYRDNKIKFSEAHPELESNRLIHAFWKHFDSRRHKKRTCFIKHLEAENRILSAGIS